MARDVILLLSGPNLNMLGTRQPEIYGTETLREHVDAARRQASSHGFDLEHRQSNHEGELVEAVQAARNRASAIVVNAGALTHYGWSLHDALAAFDGPIVELHLSDPAAREQWRSVSVIESLAVAVIAGRGAQGYPDAIDAVVAALATSTDSK